MAAAVEKKLQQCEVCKMVKNHNTEECPFKDADINQFRCSISECIEKHMYHYCKICLNNNSDHFSMNCPFQTSNPASAAAAQMKCKAPDCRENHAKHFCDYCNVKDSNHRSRNCPKRIEDTEKAKKAELEKKRQIEDERFAREAKIYKEKLTTIEKQEKEQKIKIIDQEKEIQKKTSIDKQIILRKEIMIARAKQIELIEQKIELDPREFVENGGEEIKGIRLQIQRDQVAQLVVLDEYIENAKTLESKIELIQRKIDFLTYLITLEEENLVRYANTDEGSKINERKQRLSKHLADTKDLKKVELDKFREYLMKQEKERFPSASQGPAFQPSASAAAAMSVAPKVVPTSNAFDGWNSDTHDAMSLYSIPQPPPSRIVNGVDIQNSMRTYITGVFNHTVTYVSTLDKIYDGAAVMGSSGADAIKTIYTILEDKGKQQIKIIVSGLYLGVVAHVMFDRAPLALIDPALNMGNIVWNYEKKLNNEYFIYIDYDNKRWYLGLLGDGRNRAPVIVTDVPPPYGFYFVPAQTVPILAGGSIKNYYHNKNLYKLLQHN
jgi:hypothetical protein